MECDGILSDDVVSMDIQELQFLSNMVQAVGVLFEILDIMDTQFYIPIRLKVHHLCGLLTVYVDYTGRKKWSRNGSTVEPFSCPQDGPHLGTVLRKKWLHFNKVESFFQMVPPWSRFGSTLFSV